MRKAAAAVAMMAGLTFGMTGMADAGTGGLGNQCPKGTQSVHGKCVSALAKSKPKKAKKPKKNAPVTTTTVAPTPDTTVAPAP